MFRVRQQVESSSPLLQWTTNTHLLQDPTLKLRLAASEHSSGVQIRQDVPGMDTEEGSISKADVSQYTSHMLETIREELFALLQEYKTSKFNEEAFPRYPSHGNIEFIIELEEGAQNSVSPVRKVSPT